MARRVFFSFHYDDSFRSNQVRHCNVVHGVDGSGCYDHSLYESSKGQDETIRRRIREGLRGTSVTVVLIGTHTAGRPYIEYEIQQSIKQNNGLLGVRVHDLDGPLFPGAKAPFWGPSRIGALPHSFPMGTPVMSWNAQRVDLFRNAVEAAGRRAEQLRGLGSPPPARPKVPTPVSDSLLRDIVGSIPRYEDRLKPRPNEPRMLSDILTNYWRMSDPMPSAAAQAAALEEADRKAAFSRMIARRLSAKSAFQEMLEEQFKKK
jgi:hypothetical protein